jgi:hypothetical protein
MSFSFQPFFPQSLQTIAVANASVLTATQNVVVGTVNGSKIESLVFTSTDTIDHALQVGMNVNGVVCNVANVNIPAGSGTTLGTPPVNLFANASFSFLPQDPNGNKYLYIANAACSLVVTGNSAITTAKALGWAGSAANF